MKEIVLIIRPEKLEVLKSILDQMKCGGMTISTVMGCGAQKGAVPKVRVEVVVDDSKVENIVAEVRDKVATGHVGDGKIFVRNIEEAIRIRTGERGDKVL